MKKKRRRSNDLTDKSTRNRKESNLSDISQITQPHEIQPCQKPNVPPHTDTESLRHAVMPDESFAATTSAASILAIGIPHTTPKHTGTNSEIQNKNRPTIFAFRVTSSKTTKMLGKSKRCVTFGEENQPHHEHEPTARKHRYPHYLAPLLGL